MSSSIDRHPDAVRALANIGPDHQHSAAFLTRTGDGVKRVQRFDTYRITGMLIGDQSSDYVEVLEIDDFAGFTTEDMAGSTVQSVMGQFMGFVDAPEFMIAEVIDQA